MVESSSEESSSSSSDSTSEEEEDDPPAPKGKKSSNRYKIPKFIKSGPWSHTELENIKKNWPHLRNFENSVLKNVSFKDLAGYGKNKHTGQKALSQLMTANFEAVTGFPEKIEAGTDDCLGQVHRARFLRGYVGDAQDLWLQARSHLGPDGLDPIANYELVSIGVGDLMTPKVWGEIHKPSSRTLTVRMLSQSSVDAAWRDPDKSESPKDFESIQELRMAMLTLDCVIQKVMPWNMSFKALYFFMVSIDFGGTDLAGKNARLNLVANFADEILRANARNWEERKKFLSHQDLSSRWSAFLSRNQHTVRSTDQAKKKEKTRPRPNDHQVRVPAWICKKFNAGDCDKKEDKHPSYWDPTFILKHLCSKVTDRGKLCFKNHPECQHK